MKRQTILWLVIPLLLFTCTSEQRIKERSSSSDQFSYNAGLAEELGADEYGMSQYVLALLLVGKSSILDSAERVKIQRAHMANIKRMGAAGHLVMAGPFLDADSLRGVYFFNVPTIEEAEELTKTDPAVQAGVLRFEMYQWYASAALKKVREIGKQLKKPRN